MTVHRRYVVAAAVFSTSLLPAAAFAQMAQVNTGPGTAPVQATQAPQPGSTYVPMPGGNGYGAPSNNGPVGGGNVTESSSRPVTGNQEDTFDFQNGGAGGSGAVHGSDNGPIFSGRVTLSGEVPNAHVVRRGDTLWGLCDLYFRNPYEWPKVWSYNPQIKNPNWIYPGDELRLKAVAEGGAAPGGASGAPGGSPGLGLDRHRRVPGSTVFLRDAGWISDSSDDVWGELTGAASDKLFLSDLDEVYLTLKKGHEVNVGDQLTLFRTRQTAAAGAIVQVLGTARVDDWNPKDRVARARLTETLDVIERGSKVGPVTRAFNVVAPLRNDSDVQARVLASLHPNEFFGQNQVVFIDKGEEAGLKAGNRLFVMRRGDAWRQTLVNPDVGRRVSADDERPMPPMEQTPGSTSDDSRYPTESIAELRVVDVKKNTAACLVTQARVEIELNDVVVGHKGY